MIQLYNMYKKHTLQIQRCKQKVKIWTKICHTNSNHKRAGVTILIIYSTDFKIKIDTRVKEVHFIMKKGSIH